MIAKLLLIALTVASFAAQGADRIRIGFLTTLTGPAAFLGRDMVNGAQLALEELGGRMGGVPAELVVEDDQLDPKTGVQKTRKLLESDKVNLLSGMIFGNVTAAVAGVAMKSGVITVATVGSIPNILGEGCNPNYFTVSWTIDSNYEALASYLNQAGIRTVVLMAPNYIAGKLVQAGFNRSYKGKVIGEIFTKIDQPDYSVEIGEVRAKKPQAVVVFYPGGMGINFLKQYKASGLMESIPVYSSVFLTDESTFPALGDTPLGIVTTSNWNPELDNPANKRFVAAYHKKHSTRPTSMAAMGYDTVALIAAAVRDAKGRVENTDAMRAALRKADFQSVRGPFRFGHNHFPIQSYYLNQVAKDPSGKLYNKLLGVAQKDVVDAFSGKCPMK
ncbi:MAG TPA: ABC transporter substrate-binding protein [Burkholderiales bacterium]|jgi:branched-chain amino acid transport system substrate-binding protein|nr:ABC transporter substrate-binding protein [Burkholderiales bacterium]